MSQKFTDKPRKRVYSEPINVDVPETIKYTCYWVNEHIFISWVISLLPKDLISKLTFTAAGIKCRSVALKELIYSYTVEFWISMRRVAGSILGRDESNDCFLAC